MAAIIPIIYVTNICSQTVIINVARRRSSDIFSRYGPINIAPGASIEAEDDRFQIFQLINMQNNKMIIFSKLTRSVEIVEPYRPAIEFGAYFALKQDFLQMFRWGNNSVGQLGINTITPRSSPVRVIGNHAFEHLGAFGFGIKADGSAWGWGSSGSTGGLGDNANTNRSSPVSVVGEHAFIQVDGYWSSRGLKEDGSAWAWGPGANGFIGDNTTVVNRSSPVSVVGNHSFIFNGGIIFLKADGSLWGWGRNNRGQLADNTIDARSSPVSVVGDHSFIKVACRYFNALALKADGSIWTWGGNQYGQLGQNDITTRRSSPVSVIGDHSFIDINVGYAYSFGLKTDGSIWGWGYNLRGQLGDNSISYRSSPVSVVGNISFSKLGKWGPIAQTGDGRLWAWGPNSPSGWVGDGTIINRSSPVLVLLF